MGDPALIYTANTLPLTTAVHSPLVYKTLPVAEKTEQVSTPLVYTHAIPHHQPVVYKTLPLAEKTVSVQQPIVYNAGVQTPLVYNSAVQTPLVYNTPLVNTVYNAPLTTPFMTKIFPSVRPRPRLIPPWSTPLLESTSPSSTTLLSRPLWSTTLLSRRPSTTPWSQPWADTSTPPMSVSAPTTSES